MNKIFAAVFLLAALAIPALAQNMVSTQEHLNARVQSADCRVQFQIAVMSSIQQRVPEAAGGLQANIDQLNADMAQLRTQASNGNASQFNSVMAGAVSHARNANSQMTQTRNQYRNQNSWRSARSGMMSDYQSANATYNRCADAADVALGEARLNMYQYQYEYWQNVSANLSRKGVNTSEIDALLAQAQNRIQTQLQGAVDSGDPAQVRTALRQYCLGNGCASGSNDHMLAQLQIARTEAIANYLKPDADAAGQGAQIQNVLTICTQAKAQLGSIGTSQYSAGQQAQIWGSIESANDELKGIMAQLRTGAS